MKVVAEYWLTTDSPKVIIVTEEDSIAPIMTALSAWDDVFSWTVVPAVTGAEGLELAKKMA